MRKVILAVLLSAALGLTGALGLTACATPGTGAGPSPTGTVVATTTAPSIPSMTPIKVSRTGGMAGVNQSLVVSLDGSWVYTDGKTGQSQRGQLTAAQLSPLLALLADPTLPSQLAPRATGSQRCADGFEYSLQFGQSDVFHLTDCGQLPPAASAMLTALSAATPF